MVACSFDTEENKEGNCMRWFGWISVTQLGCLLFVLRPWQDDSIRGS